MGKLTVAKVRSAKPGTRPDGSPTKSVLQDGEGLFLSVAPTGAKAWVLRVQVEGKRRDIGLGAVVTEGPAALEQSEDGPLADVPLMLRKSLTLAEARAKARTLRQIAKAGRDPVAERDRERERIPTFAEAVIEAHRALATGWSEKTGKAFLASLEEHAIPRMGTAKVDAIGSAEVIAALAPIWTDKPVMARKVRSRIGQVLAFAKARGWRSNALPDARELRSGLSKQQRGGNFAAMPFVDLPAFVASELGKAATAGRQAMLFAI
ncbi:MAG: Arm DNA-binding domain-containing protein, partial [Sphingomonadaceae bacterium]